MIIFVVDEDLPRSIGRAVSTLGHKALDVRDCGLRGASDAEVLRFAVSNSAVVLTGDRGFGNLLRYPLGTHCGIVVLHLPNEIGPPEMSRILVEALVRLTPEDLAGNLTIIDANKTRITRARRV